MIKNYSQTHQTKETSACLQISFKDSDFNSTLLIY